MILAKFKCWKMSFLQIKSTKNVLNFNKINEKLSQSDFKSFISKKNMKMRSLSLFKKKKKKRRCMYWSDLIRQTYSHYKHEPANHLCHSIPSKIQYKRHFIEKTDWWWKNFYFENPKKNNSLALAKPWLRLLKEIVLGKS